MNLLLWTTDLVSLGKLLDSKLGKPGVKLRLDLVLSQREVGIQVKFLLAPLLALYTRISMLSRCCCPEGLLHR